MTLPVRQDLLSWGPVSHPHVASLNLTAWYLKRRYYILKVVKTLVNFLKPVTRAIYSKVWKKCNLSVNQRFSHNVPSILEFFKESANKGLSLSTLKVWAVAIRFFPPVFSSGKSCYSQIFFVSQLLDQNLWLLEHVPI